jgi:hypothetical protein
MNKIISQQLYDKYKLTNRAVPFGRGQLLIDGRIPFKHELARSGFSRITSVVELSQVTIVSWDGNDKDKVSNCLKQFGKVDLYVPHQNQVAPARKKDRLSIFIWSAHDGPENDTEETECPEMMYGIDVDCQDGPFKFIPSPGYVPIISPEGDCVAEINGTDLFIFHDVVNEGSDKEIIILENIVRQALSLNTIDPSFFISKKIPVDFDIDNPASSIEKQIRDIASYKYVDQIYFDGNVVIKTKTLTFIVDKEEFKLGRMKIKIDPEGFKNSSGIDFDDEGSPITIKNLTRTASSYERDDMQAPHVFSDGHPCLGSAVPRIREFLKNKDLFGLVLYLIEFLRSADPHDGAGSGYRLWPSVKETPQNYGSRVDGECCMDGNCQECDEKNDCRNCDGECDGCRRYFNCHPWEKK